MYPRCGSTFRMVSPFSVITRCSTPCVAGCCGPTLMTNSPSEPLAAVWVVSFSICVSVYMNQFMVCNLSFWLSLLRHSLFLVHLFLQLYHIDRVFKILAQGIAL